MMETNPSRLEEKVESLINETWIAAKGLGSGYSSNGITPVIRLLSIMRELCGERLQLLVLRPDLVCL